MPAVQPPDVRAPAPQFLLSAPLAHGAGGHLPVALTSLIARDQELAAVVALLRDPGVRLLTVTGPGGVGKTRLAIAAATAVADDFPDGVVFVSLAPITDPDLVLPTIAGALGLRDMGAASLPDRLLDVLADRRVLLILDNVEQVVTAGSRLRDLLGACRGVTLLVTSRSRMRLSGEREFPVAPPPLPQSDPVAGEDARESGAVRLFVERAQAVEPDFRLTSETLPAVSAIVSRVDGLPLAIELAAARVKALPPAALLQRLEQRLPLLSGGARDLPPRHQTMRDTIAWSYDLLNDLEQALFRRLSVFVGGFTLDAAEAIGAAAADGSSELRAISAIDTMDGITSLIDHSLLRQSVAFSDEPRYQMLETVREFGLERLKASGETEDFAVRAAHAAHALALAVSQWEREFTPGFEEMLARLDAERDNIRAALGWAEEAGEAEIGLRLAEAMSFYWLLRGHFHEGRGWLERALRRGDQAPAALRMRAMIDAGWFAGFQGDYAAAAAVLTEAIGGARRWRFWRSARRSCSGVTTRRRPRGPRRRSRCFYRLSIRQVPVRGSSAGRTPTSGVLPLLRTISTVPPPRWRRRLRGHPSAVFPGVAATPSILWVTLPASAATWSRHCPTIARASSSPRTTATGAFSPKRWPGSRSSPRLRDEWFRPSASPVQRRRCASRSASQSRNGSAPRTTTVWNWCDPPCRRRPSWKLGQRGSPCRYRPRSPRR